MRVAQEASSGDIALRAQVMPLGFIMVYPDIKFNPTPLPLCTRPTANLTGRRIPTRMHWHSEAQLDTPVEDLAYRCALAR